MFEFVRTHQRLMQAFLLLLIAPSFAFFGVQGFNRYRDGAAGLATVAGQSISQQDFDAAQRNQMERMQQMLGPSYDPKMFDTPEARKRVLDTLISQRVLQTEMAKDRLWVSDAEVSEEIRKIPAIKNLYKADGTLDVARYDQLLSSVGLTRDSMFAQTRNQILMRELVETIPNSTILPKPALQRLNALLDQERQIAQLSFSPADYLEHVSLPADAAQKYYDTHHQEFEVAEHLDVQYVVLDQAAIMQHTQVSPEEVAAFYKLPANQARYTIPEQRRASHILIAVAKDAPPAVRDKAKIKAQDILAKVRADPAQFASLAKQYSDDPGSAERGGDLDFAPAANYVKPFSDALFALKDHQISDLVETEFGYHIIQLTDIHPGSVRSLDEVRGDIESELKKQKASASFSQAAEDFSNLVYDQPDSLQPAVDKFGLTLQSAEGVTRAIDPKRNSPVDNPRVVDALFSSDVLKAKHNTGAIETAPDVLVAARVIADHPPALKPFAEVEASITKQLTNDAAQRLAHEAGAAHLAALQKQADDSGFLPARALRRSAPGPLPAAAVKAIFAADVSHLPTWIGVDLPNGVYSIFRIDSVSVPPATPQTLAADQQRSQQLARQVGELEFSGYLEGLKKRMKVEISKTAAVSPDATSSGSPATP